MATAKKPSRGSPTRSPIDELARAPYRFDFFQAVRLLQWAARERSMEEQQDASQPVGYDFAPAEEAVRFQALPSLSFPSSAISRFRRGDDHQHGPPEMEVTFLGLFGPHGTLPRHYTQMIIDRGRMKDTGLRDFLDKFNHRILSHFYRAWAKHRLPIAFEASQRRPNQASEDPFTRLLYSLVGLGTAGLRRRLEVSDPTFLYFSGHFAHAQPQAITLAAMVGDYFAVDAEVQQFCGQWLQLDIPDQSQLSGSPATPGSNRSLNNQLGCNVVVGERVWSVENRFRMRLGPLDYAQFSAFTPAGRKQIPLAQLVRTYVGPEYDFDVQLVLRRDEVPLSRLASQGELATCRLGWNSWIFSRPMAHDADDAAFICEGRPSFGCVNQGSQI